MIRKYWQHIFRLLLVLLFIISFAVTIRGIEGGGDQNKSAYAGTGMVAAACLICSTLVELHIWKKKDNQ